MAIGGWSLVFLAGACEIIMTLFLKHSDGFKNLVPSILMLIAVFFSFYFLSLAIRTVPLSSAYAIWTGIGAVGTFIIGVLVFGDTLSLTKVIFLFLTLFGIIGLKMAS